MSSIRRSMLGFARREQKRLGRETYACLAAQRNLVNPLAKLAIIMTPEDRGRVCRTVTRTVAAQLAQLESLLRMISGFNADHANLRPIVADDLPRLYSLRCDLRRWLAKRKK